jgi:hypothetical protein
VAEFWNPTRFRCRPHAFGTSAVVHSRSPSRLAPDASCAPFPQCSPPRLIHRSSLRWFRTSPCMSGPGGPTSITSAAPQPATRSSTSHPPAVFVAHGSQRPSTSADAWTAAATRVSERREGTRSAGTRDAIIDERMPCRKSGARDDLPYGIFGNHSHKSFIFHAAPHRTRSPT